MTVAPTFDLAELFRRVDRARTESGRSWAFVSRQVGVSVSTIRRFETARDAEADGVLALIRWLGVAPEAFVGAGLLGERLLASSDGGFVRVDMESVVEVTGGRRDVSRTSIQRLVDVAQSSGRSIASFTRWSAV